MAASSLAFAPAMAGVACADDQDGSRFSLSLHQFSVKKLIDNGTLNSMDYPRFVKESLGISNVEYAADFYEPTMSESDAKKLREQAEKAGVTNRAVLCTGARALDAADANERQVAVDYFAKWGSVAANLGCEFVRIRATGEGDRQNQLGYAADGIGRLCDKLESSGVSVLVENITGLSRDPEWLVALVEKVGPQRLGLIADFGNFDGDLYEGMKHLLPHTKSICTKSWEFDSQGNETKIDFEKMMGVIKQSDFRGCIAIEYLGPDPMTGIPKTAKLVRQFS